MAKFTPGPWEVVLIRGDRKIQHEQSRALIAKITTTEELPNSRDNFNLIAASPDMYEALEWIQQLHANGAFKLTDEDYIAICKVADALAKAEGRRGGDGI